MGWYRGAASVNSGSNQVVGYGTLFASQVKSGDMFLFNDNKTDFYEVLSVEDDTHLTLGSNYAGSNRTNSPFAIIQNFTNTPNAELAAKHADLLQKTQARDLEFNNWLTGAYNGGPNSDGKYPITNLLGVVTLVPCPALFNAYATGETETPRVARDGLFNLVKYPSAGWYQTIDLSSGSVFHVVLDQSDSQLVFTNPTQEAGFAQHFSLILEQGTGGNDLTDWPANVRWNQSRRPILSVLKGQRDVVDFFSVNQGATWMGFFGGTQIPE